MYAHAAVRYGTSTRSTIEERIVYFVYRHRHHLFFRLRALHASGASIR